ncbi:hypothetical protein [Mucisphaera sp.]|uniref:hypothetical protein n=1 Tax=Mucisphaera sp. TaxID=2913024 RepID=UPI003D0B01A5
MKPQTLLASLALATCTAPASALELAVTSKPTVGLATHTTYTLTLLGDGELNAIQIEFRNLTLNQETAFGQIGLFADDGLFAFVPTTADTDSYFLFDRPSLLVEAGESDTGMNVISAFPDNQSAPIPLAQLVIPDSAPGVALFPVDPQFANILIRGGVGDDANTIIASLGIPTPATGALLALIAPALIKRRR